MRRIAVAVTALLCWAGSAHAQTFRPPDVKVKPWTAAQLNLGPIYFAPTFELSGLGIDNNVLNSPTNPERDLTGTLTMRSLIGLHVGNVVLQVTQGNSYIYFRRFQSERSIDSSLGALLEFRTDAIRPWIRWERQKTHQRAGIEIDARAERKIPNFDYGVDLNTFLRLGITAAGRHASVAYAEDEVFDGVNLSQVLNNTSDSYQGLVRYELNDLTDLLVGAEYLRDRFQNSPLRSNDSWYYYGGLRTKQGATFVGSATAGFRRQLHSDPSVPDFSGLIAKFELSLVPSEFVRFDLNAGRDSSYSYQEAYPYVVDQGGTIAMTNRFADRFDLVASAQGQWLRYDKTIGGGSDARTDRTTVYGIGAGFYLGGGTGKRMGFLYEHAQRVSPVDSRNYVTNRISTNYRLAF